MDYFPTISSPLVEMRLLGTSADLWRGKLLNGVVKITGRDLYQLPDVQRAGVEVRSAIDFVQHDAVPALVLPPRRPADQH